MACVGRAYQFFVVQRLSRHARCETGISFRRRHRLDRNYTKIRAVKLRTFRIALTKQIYEDRFCKNKKRWDNSRSSENVTTMENNEGYFQYFVFYKAEKSRSRN